MSTSKFSSKARGSYWYPKFSSRRLGLHDKTSKFITNKLLDLKLRPHLSRCSPSVIEHDSNINNRAQIEGDAFGLKSNTMPVTGCGDDKQDEKLFLTPDADSERLRQEMLSLEDFMENTD